MNSNGKNTTTVVVVIVVLIILVGLAWFYYKGKSASTIQQTNGIPPVPSAGNNIPPFPSSIPSANPSANVPNSGATDTGSAGSVPAPAPVQ
ncbi:MAG: hypothetical protein M1505_00780 [Patescibacteria group bacterium]|nr:hypothetical protein [Patescibacteria group bacterium]